MNTVLYTTCAVVGLLALALRLPAFIRRPDPGLGGLCCYFALVAFTYTLSVPAIWLSVDRWFGIPNASGFIAQCGALSIGFAKLWVIFVWTNPWSEAKRKLRILVVITAVLLAVMTVLFSIAVRDMSSNPKHFAADSARITAYSFYLIVYLSGYIIAAIATLRQCWRYMRKVGPGWLRWGLLTAAVGSAIGLPYAGARFADIFAVRLGIDNHAWEPVARIATSIGTVVIVTGWTMPIWGPPLSAAWARAGRYHTYRQLRPLWQALYEVLPDIALTHPPRSAVIDWPWNITFHLYRRLIEIRDARTALLPFYDIDYSASVRRRAVAQGLTGRRLDAVVEASNLAAAIESKRQFDLDPPTLGGPVPFVAAHLEEPDETGGNLPDERDWLVMVAQAFARSPSFAEVIGPAPGMTSSAARG